VEGLEHEADVLAPPERAGVVAEGADVHAIQRDRALVPVSSAAMQFSSVDLPTPDSPTMATNSPGATLSETLANTAVSP
jgi:hypothetical protein